MTNQYYFEPQNDRSVIFLNEDEAIKYLKVTQRIKQNETCNSCTSPMTLQVDKKYLNGVCFKCVNRNCRKVKSILDGFKIITPKIPIHNYLYVIYRWIENSSSRDTARNGRISKSSLYKIKCHLVEWCKSKLNNNRRKLGGKGKQIQVDETAVCHGNLPTAPSTMSDDFPGVTWLIGIIEVETQEIRLETIKNRTKQTFASIFKKYIEEESIIVTDGHKSYPFAVSQVNGSHKIVNHSKGFTNEEGDNTNSIENIWSLLKLEIHKRKGILRSNFEEFLAEFLIKYEILPIKSQLYLIQVFDEVIDYLFNK